MSVCLFSNFWGNRNLSLVEILSTLSEKREIILPQNVAAFLILMLRTKRDNDERRGEIMSEEENLKIKINDEQRGEMMNEEERS